jgi:hypothetical protein
MDAISRYEVSLAKGNQPRTYQEAMVANTTGAPVNIATSTPGTPGATPGTATANVNIAPLYSRIELVKVVGGPTVQSFTVTGVFVDNYFSRFTLTGNAAGPIKYQRQSTEWGDNIGDTGSWPSTGATGNTVSQPPIPTGGTANDVWAYHVASADMPRLIIRVESMLPAAPQAVSYLTVTSWNGVGANRFERGQIYRIGNTVNNTGALMIDPNKLAPVPNADYVNVTVNVTVDNWQIVPITANI